MMKILTRYVVFDLLKIFLTILSGLTAMIFIGLLGKQAVDNGLGLGPLLRMTPYLLPDAMQFAIPGTMLLATTYVYGRLASYNEIVAIKSLGISPMVLVWPALILATLISFAGVYVNNLAVSWGKQGQERVVIESIDDILYGALKIRRSYTLGKFSIIVRRVEGRKLIQPTVIESSPNGPAKTVRAKEAELWFDSKERKLTIIAHDYEVNGPVNGTDPGTLEQVFSYDEIMGNSSKLKSPSNYSLGEIPLAIDASELKVEQLQQSMTAQTSFAMLSGDFFYLAQQNWKWREKELDGVEQRLCRLHLEPWRRWANGFSCLGFVLIGVPVAMWLRFSEFLATFFLCFAPILIIYYPMMVVSVSQAKDGTFPPQTVWIGNIMLAIAGIWMLRRVNRH
jgi:lipopolysaccharide export system permease protein